MQYNYLQLFKKTGIKSIYTYVKALYIKAFTVNLKFKMVFIV